MTDNSKLSVFADLLATGRVRIHLDARRPGVVLPVNLLHEKQVALDYGRALSIPTTDVCVDEFGVSATLSFDGKLTACFVPWPAVFAVTDGEGHGKVFAEAMPEEFEITPSRRANGQEGWVN